MAMMAICQRCKKRDHYWMVKQAEISVGSLDHWKLQLCEDCTKAVEAAVLFVLDGAK